MTMQYLKLFEPSVLAAAAGTIFTVAAGQLLRGGIVRLTNTTVAPVTATLYAVPSGGALGPANACFPTKNIPANDYIDVALPLMRAGDFLQAVAGAAASISISAMSGANFS